MPHARLRRRRGFRVDRSATRTFAPRSTFMSLVDTVKAICTRLGASGWLDLLALHGLDIAADDLGAEFTRPLDTIRRDVPGFEDFALEGVRGIEPGHPARSLLYHALASPNVLRGADGSDLTEFCT